MPAVETREPTGNRKGKGRGKVKVRKGYDSTSDGSFPFSSYLSHPYHSFALHSRSISLRFTHITSPSSLRATPLSSLCSFVTLHLAYGTYGRNSQMPVHSVSFTVTSCRRLVVSHSRFLGSLLSTSHYTVPSMPFSQLTSISSSYLLFILDIYSLPFKDLMVIGFHSQSIMWFLPYGSFVFFITAIGNENRTG